MNKQPLTKTQKQTLDFLKGFFRKNGYMPSHKELAKHFKIKLGGSTEHRLKMLEKTGHISRRFFTPRNIVIID